MDEEELTRRRALQLGTVAFGVGSGVPGIAAAQESSNEIVVSNVGFDESATYEFTVGGSVSPLSSPAGDNVDGNRAWGGVYTWKDGYSYTGEITSFSHDGPVRVYVNGTEVDPATLGSGTGDGGDGGDGSTRHELIIDNRGFDESATYEFTVGGSVEPLSSPSGDNVDGNRAWGGVYTWKDGYSYTGEVTSFSYDGPMRVYVDGTEVDPATLGSGTGDGGGGETPAEWREIVVSNVGFDESATYEFTVDEVVESLPEPGGDTVEGTRASGGVYTWKDGYRFKREVTSFSYDGPVRVYVDGEEVDPDTLGADEGDDPSPAGPHPTLEKVGHLLLDPTGGTSEVMVRADGRYGVVGTKWGATGSYLVDLATPENPTLVHHLDDGRANYDAKFDHRDGLYYRTGDGTEVVDYGYTDAASPSNPRVVDSLGDWAHNLYAHTAAPVLYTVNYSASTAGFDAWDTSDPTNVRRVGTFGPSGNCHDLVVEADRDRLHVAYQTPHGTDGFVGYLLYDISDPLTPREVGRFDYRGRTPYYDASVGQEAFGYGHHADFDPERDVVVIGDERSWGTPGGKHVLDVSDPSNIEARGFAVSPNAQRMASGETSTRYDWTGHHFDFVPWGESTYIVSGDWHDGVVLYDVTDLDTVAAVDRYVTDDVSISPNAEVAAYGDAPMAWNAAYDDTRDLVVANDVFTGLYVFELVE